MDKNTERIERYLKGIDAPPCDCVHHRQQLRRRILAKIEGRQTMSTRARSWRYAAAIALIGTGVVTAAAVGVKYRHLKTEDGRHVVVNEDGRKAWSFSEKTAGSPEQAVQTAEEMHLLIEQGRKELVSVQETEVDGQLDNRKLGYQYTLSDGRTIKQFENDPDTGPGTLTKEQEKEVDRLWRDVLAGLEFIGTPGRPPLVLTATGAEVPTYERVVQGRSFTFDKVAVTLADGAKVTRSIGRPADSRPRPTALSGGNATGPGPSREDLREWLALRQQNKGQVVAVDDLTVNGVSDRRVFVYRYRLSDGRTLDMREGAGGTPILSPAQRQEWARYREAGSGQDLGTSEEQILGRTFTFTRKRYVLSDGTEAIWSYGKPKE